MDIYEKMILEAWFDLSKESGSKDSFSDTADLLATNLKETGLAMDKLDIRHTFIKSN